MHHQYVLTLQTVIGRIQKGGVKINTTSAKRLEQQRGKNAASQKKDHLQDLNARPPKKTTAQCRAPWPPITTIANHACDLNFAGVVLPVSSPTMNGWIIDLQFNTKNICNTGSLCTDSGALWGQGTKDMYMPTAACVRRATLVHTRVPPSAHPKTQEQQGNCATPSRRPQNDMVGLKEYLKEQKIEERCIYLEIKAPAAHLAGAVEAQRGFERALKTLVGGGKVGQHLPLRRGGSKEEEQEEQTTCM
ncbi:hypothetical protein C8R44DRAFT_733449 [Mycena epipterygia]|nr:hypothetical protein C8R44DRAFT_733449 [Mycena epipterygia]